MVILKLRGSGIELEIRDAMCNFCGENKNRCIKGVVPSLSESITTEWKRVAVGKPGLSFFSSKWTFEDWNWEDVVVARKVERDDFDICFDCVKQLNQLIAKLGKEKS